jgi:nucleoid-associated protein YgaU
MPVETPATCDVVYTVQPADAERGLLAVARRLYGDPDRWPALYDANRAVIGNNPAVLRAGQHLVVPGLRAAPGPGGGARVYVVQPGDARAGLRGIAEHLYGDPDRWPELYAVNRGVVGDDPDRLQPGQRLVAPAGLGPPLPRLGPGAGP